MNLDEKDVLLWIFRLGPLNNLGLVISACSSPPPPNFPKVSFMSLKDNISGWFWK
jgi:hypothetical protein